MIHNYCISYSMTQYKLNRWDHVISSLLSRDTYIFSGLKIKFGLCKKSFFVLIKVDHCIDIMQSLSGIHGMVVQNVLIHEYLISSFLFGGPQPIIINLHKS